MSHIQTHAKKHTHPRGPCIATQMMSVGVFGNVTEHFQTCLYVAAEALAGVPLPRSDGTCTRCPTEV